MHVILLNFVTSLSLLESLPEEGVVKEERGIQESVSPNKLVHYLPIGDGKEGRGGNNVHTHTHIRSCHSVCVCALSPSDGNVLLSQ